MRLFLLISLCFLGMMESSRPGCVYQVKTRMVKSGDSVTISCSYTNTEKWGENVQIIWVEDNRQFCSYDSQRIFRPSSNVIEKYKERLYSEKDPYRNTTETITITGLKPTDGPKFCCLLYESKHNIPIKQNLYGTLLQFPDTESITQLDELIAVSSEEITIPCYYSKGTSDIIYLEWNLADPKSNLCTDTNILKSNHALQYGWYSVVNFTHDISLRIHNVHVNNHQSSYCCVVSTAQRTLGSNQFTRLIVAGYQPSWDQPTKEITIQEGLSVNLSCSYALSSQYTERDIVRVNVYWRVGNVTGPYAYHPYQQIINSTYRQRTQITGMTNLMINGVKMTDNNSFHCFVVVKLCASDDYYNDEIYYGGGTRLIVTGKDVSIRAPPDGIDDTHPDTSSPISQKLMFIIIAVSSSVIVLIILIVILIILKVKGVICKKKNSFSEQQMNSIQAAGGGDVTSEETPYCEISPKVPGNIPLFDTDEVGKSEDNLLYAKINKDKFKEKRPASQAKQNEEVVYAAVVTMTSK
ncbi:uncharacterized protein [Pyxicephalus adspersus]|uniref:uncharacterized protein isoform X2 n=1 Tax=Pyxicephalus adspersus TaxID=30357 RepID=UPI003B5BA413